MLETFLLACSTAGLLAASVLPSAAVVTGSCTPTKTQFSASTLADSTTTSSAFVNVPQAIVTFTQGGTSPSCVLVRFTASTYTQDAIDALSIRAFMDNATAGMPSELAARSQSDAFGYPKTYEFLFPSVATGSHTIRIQFNNSKGATSHIGPHITIVQFKP